MKRMLLINILYGSCDILQTLFHPSAFFIKTIFPVEFVKTLVSLYNIKSDAGLEFAETDRTEVERPRVAFLQMI